MLTKRQKQILDYIKKFIKENDYAPTIEEIKRHFRLSSLATVHKHIENLRSKGELRKVENQPRSIRLNNSNKRSDLIEIPLLGTIAAGAPIEAIEFLETISVPKSQLSKSGEHFALRVQGNSMIDEGIFDRDVVVIRKQPDAENGETVVALINNDEVTLKKIYKEKNRFRLQPANPNLKPIYAKELVIQGKVISVIRNYEKPKQTKIKNNDSEFAAATTDYINQTDINYRKSLGQYFTPKSIREMLLEKLPKMENPKILDPACGTGGFLVTAKKYFNNPELCGWDIDKKLVDISKNLIPEANLNRIDSLLNGDYNKYDFVIGNPPYYEFKAPEKIRRKFGSVMNGRTNIFSLFVYQGLNWLKDGGYLAYVIPPSMNNGAYFYKLRNYIIHNANIEYLQVLRDPKIFHGALQSTMLLVLKKGKNKGDYLFKKNGVLIFSEGAKYLQRVFKDKMTLHDLNYQVRTGRLVWNKNKNLLTDNPKEGIPLIWAHNITEEGLDFPVINGKPQYVKRKDFDVGPAIVVNRITGTVKKSKLKAGFIPSGMKFIAENHVNVIFPPSKQEQIKMDFVSSQPKKNLPIENIVKQISSIRGLRVIKNITGNTQISKNELEKLFPISLNC
ncbi:MAG: transcriptional repressor LexA [Patescibacteria group bacterium]|nr:transcriptional repressor LexA [Patescibacteria group bacterium]